MRHYITLIGSTHAQVRAAVQGIETLCAALRQFDAATEWIVCEKLDAMIDNAIAQVCDTINRYRDAEDEAISYHKDETGRWNLVEHNADSIVIRSNCILYFIHRKDR